MSALKVVVVVPWAQRSGGAENILWSFLRNLDRSRIDPRVVFLEPGPFEEEMAAHDIRTAVIEAGRLRQPVRFARAVRALARLIRSERAHLVLDWSAKTHLYGSLATRGKAAWWQQGITHGHWLDRIATALPTSGVATYSSAAAHAQQKLRPRRRVLVVPPGLEEPTRVQRAEVEIPAGRFVVGAVGRLEPGKRLDVVIEVVAELVKRGHDVHGLIVGGSAFGLSRGHEPELRALAASLSLDDRITFTGQVPDATAYMLCMDVLASASESESFGMTIVEALALGLPVVAIAAGGPDEILEDGVSGLLLRERGAAPLTDAIERVIVDHDLRQRFADAGRDRFQASFTAKRAAARFMEALEHLAGDDSSTRDAADIAR